MLRGQSQSGSQFGSRALGRCKSNIENPVIVDLDVVIIDVPETSEQGSRRSRKRRSRQSFPSDPITIIDEEGDTIGDPRNSHGKASYPTSSNFISTEGSDSDECLMIISERNFASKSAAKKRVYCKNKCSKNRFGLYHRSDSDSSDCEIVEDPSGNVREQWEKASLSKRTSVKDQLRSENQDTAVGSRADPISSSPEDDAENLSNKVRSNNCEDAHVDKSSSNSTSGKENASSSIPVLEIITEKAPVEINAFQSTDPSLSSPKTVHDKVDAESFTNNLNHCENVLVDKSRNDSNKGKGNTSFSVPMVDSTTEVQLETSGIGSGSDSLFCSPETTHEKGCAESSTNQAYPDHNNNVLMDRSPSKSSNGKEASSNIPTFDVITEKSPPETSTPGSRADPLFSSRDTTHVKVDAEFFSNKSYLNNCTGAPFGSSTSNSSKLKDNASSSAPTADVLTAKPSLKTSAFRLYVDSLSSSPEIPSDKVGAGSCTNTMYSNCCRDVPVDNSSTSSNTQKEHMSSNIPSADNLKEKLPPEANMNNISSRVPTDKCTEEPPLKTDVNTCIADSSPTCGAHGEPRLQNEGMTLEKYSSGAKSTDETLFDNKSVAFIDVEVPLWVPSSCNSRLRHNKRYVASFHEKDHIPGEPSCDTESWYKVNVEHEVFGFQGKEKSVSEPSVARREPISNHHGESGTIVTDHYKESDHLVDMLREDLMGERERHKESDLYKRAVEEEWAARIQQLQIQAEEANQLRRKRKAEKQVLDMEKRQKQRLEEIRESQRKGEETLSLKEKLRSEVRKELDQMELRYRNMASLLRALGIHVEGGANPLSREVSTAYKKAVLKFHPDRSSRLEIRQQVEAEEKFKLISRLKEKLLP